MKKLLQKDDFDALLSASSGVQFLGPVKLKGRGRFSDTDLIKYGQIKSFTDIVWDNKTYLSAKELILPITETLLDFTGTTVVQPPVEDAILVLFLRACDIHAIQRLDNIFLNNGPSPDPYYKQKRDRIKLVLMECAVPFDSCFCVAMGTNTVSDFGAAVRCVEDGILIDIRDEWFTSQIAGSGTDTEFELQFPQQNGADVHVPHIKEMKEQLFTHEMWDEYSKRCIACGRCNTSCPTCSCFSVQDISYGHDSNRIARRQRVWDGCHLDGFTDMAGGASFRNEYGPRMRFKTFHKIYDYRKRYGVNMCVGCGRCDDVCPEYISFANCINKVNVLVNETRSTPDE
jgi:anaerobic sulfite reductase subunit A